MGLIVAKNEQDLVGAMHANRDLLSKISFLDKRPLENWSLDVSSLARDYISLLDLKDNYKSLLYAEDLQRSFLHFMKNCIADKKLPDEKPSSLFLYSLLKRANILNENGERNNDRFSQLLSLYTISLEGMSQTTSDTVVDFLLAKITPLGEVVYWNNPQHIVQSYGGFVVGSTEPNVMSYSVKNFIPSDNLKGVADNLPDLSALLPKKS